MRRIGEVFARATLLALASACVYVGLRSAVLVRAEWLRSHPTPANVMEAILLDPLNAYGWTLRAERFEDENRPAAAESAWRRALERDGRNAEYRIRLAVLLEQRGALKDSEAMLRRAAAQNRTWLARWALVNFYIRRGRPVEATQWAREALLRAADDVNGLFSTLDGAGIPIDTLLPPNRRVIASLIGYRLRSNNVAGLEPACVRLAVLIPRSLPEWPGLDAPPWRAGEYPADEWERWALLGSVGRLLDADDGPTAVRVWNTLALHRVLHTTASTPLSPVVNSRFDQPSQHGGLDWIADPGVGYAVYMPPESDDLEVTLSGSQPETANPLDQRVVLPAGRAYRLVIESRASGLASETGLRWELRSRDRTLAAVAVPGSDAWSESTAEVPAMTAAGVVTLALAYSRAPGTVRAQGEAHFRRVALEPVQ